jgi:VanZ family protein
MLDLGIVWHVVTEPELLAIIAGTLLVAWPLGTMPARRNGCARTVGVLFVVLTFAVELWQAYIGRGGELVDVLHNSVGALLGAVIGAIWLRASTHLASQGTV